MLSGACPSLAQAREKAYPRADDERHNVFLVLFLRTGFLQVDGVASRQHRNRRGWLRVRVGTDVTAGCSGGRKGRRHGARGRGGCCGGKSRPGVQRPFQQHS